MKISPTCDDSVVVVGNGDGEEVVDAVDGRKEGWRKAGEEEEKGWARSAEESS